MTQKRMLLVFAHPDDESFGMGATIAKYAREGVQIDLICATNGEAGEVPDEYLDDYESIAELRMAELECAMENLGINKLHRFDYRDSGMAGSPDNDHPNALVQADLDEVTERVARVIREVRPHVVVTFDSYGGYGHPDHIVMHKATIAAYDAAGSPGAYPDQGLEPFKPQRLYHTNFGRFTRFSLRLAVIMARLRGQDPEHMGQNHDVDLVSVARNVHPTHVRIDVHEYLDLGDRASSCHASQLGALSSVIPRWARRWFFGDQSFTQLDPLPQRRGIARDLFNGVAV
jgi:LmbE family N-acetylglucosaminyl deacetylase